MKTKSAILTCAFVSTVTVSCNMTYNYNSQISDSTKSAINSDKHIEVLDNDKEKKIASKIIQIPEAPNDEFVDYRSEYTPQVLLDEETYKKLYASDSNYLHEWKDLEGVITDEPTKENSQYEIIITKSKGEIGALRAGQSIIISFLSEFTETKKWMGRSSMINLNGFMIKGRKIKFNCTDAGGTSIEFYFTYIKPLIR